DFTYYIGFKIGRLWGVFLNLNRGAASVAVSSLLLVYFIKTIKKTWFRIIAGIAIFINLLYTALADSRTGALGFGLCFGFLAFFLLIYKLKDKKFWYKLLAVFCAALAFVAGYFLPIKMKSAYNSLMPMVYNAVHSNEEDQSGEDEADDKNRFLVERGYDLSDDISNRRFDVWKSGIEILLNSKRNIIIGTSFNGMLPYAKDNLPETYIVDNDFGIIGTMDNDFFNLLVGQGLLGILLFVILVIGVVVLIFKHFGSVKPENAFLLSVMLAVLFAIAGCSMFTSLVLYYLSQNAIIFWSFLGMSVFLLKPKKEKSENE
ncbi:MAG: O-antigen ligase family protein, partial [Clostridia bacterium]|nr:O-antigen ligase family protein [Clostridia bacterium]